MTETIASGPAEPAVRGKTHGGFADIARRLSALHPERHPFSRQLVERWYKCRPANGMPERRPVTIDGRDYVLFNLAEVEHWHARRLSERNVRPPIETIPLFDVDRTGHPVDAETHRGHPEVRENYRSTSILDL